MINSLRAYWKEFVKDFREAWSLMPELLSWLFHPEPPTPTELKRRHYQALANRFSRRTWLTGRELYLASVPLGADLDDAAYLELLESLVDEAARSDRDIFEVVRLRVLASWLLW